MTETRVRLSDLMGGDHHDLDERWERFQNTPASDRTRRRTIFDSFRADLLHHIAIEEEELFPRILSADPAQRGLVGRLLDEHRQIKEALDRLSEGLASGSGSIDRLGLELINVLWEHNAREEASAYPWLDDHLTAPEVLEVRDDLARRRPR